MSPADQRTDSAGRTTPAADQTAEWKKEVKILVLGDLHVDTIIVPLPRPAKSSAAEAWESEGNCWRCRRPGGAWLLQEIIQAAVTFDGSEKVLVNGYDA